jgi:hypothetical protein
VDIGANLPYTFDAKAFMVKENEVHCAAFDRPPSREQADR